MLIPAFTPAISRCGSKRPRSTPEITVLVVRWLEERAAGKAAGQAARRLAQRLGRVRGFATGCAVAWALAACDADQAQAGDDSGLGPAPSPWTGCATPCVDDYDLGTPGFGRCVAHFDPAEATKSAGGFGHPDAHARVAGPPGGSLDVVSLGCGGSIVVDLGPDGASDGPGPDLIVFENPFSVEFPEAGRVFVSADGCGWEALPCDATGLEGCAGVTPTLASPGDEVGARDPATAGGDHFDLAEAGLTWVRFVRIVDDSQPYWDDIGGDWCDPGAGGKGGFDLDAIAVVHD